ncbi:MAG: hypothetical protein ACLFQV_04090 [Vulcanimicrobiota bacterium]
MKRSVVIILTLCFFMTLTTQLMALEAPGNIFFHKQDGVYVIQPDGRDEKKILEKAQGQVLPSPDGRKLLYVIDNALYISNMEDNTEKIIYQGNQDQLFPYRWLPDSDSFIFRTPDADKLTYYILSIGDKQLKKLGSFYEPPSFSPNGKYWVYSDWTPGCSKSEVHGGNIGEEGNYVFTGRMTDVLSWDKDINAVLYGINDKLYGFDLDNRGRQIIPLRFKKIEIIAYGSSTMIFHYKNPDEDGEGLNIYDTEVGEQNTIIDKVKGARKVSMNKAGDKIIIFIPMDPDRFLWEGDLYFIDFRQGTANKITKDLGQRIFREINMDYQWSPDGKYFVYDNIRMRYSKPKKTELFMTEGKEKPHKMWKKKFFDQLLYPTWAELK